MCADDCEGIMGAAGGGGDHTMQRCVEACHSCARTCEEVKKVAQST